MNVFDIIGLSLSGIKEEQYQSPKDSMPWDDAPDMPVPAAEWNPPLQMVGKDYIATRINLIIDNLN